MESEKEMEIEIEQEGDTPIYVSKRLDLRPISFLIDSHGARVVQIKKGGAIHVRYIDTDGDGTFISSTEIEAFMEFAEINGLKHIGVSIEDGRVSALFFM